MVEATTGTDTSLRVIVTSLRLPSCATVSVTSVPDGPLMRVVATSPLTPASVFPFTATKTSPATIPARLAGEPSKTFDDAQALGVGRDAHADTREAAVLRLLEARVLGRREVLREAVVELRDDARDRVVGELRARDLAVVRALDQVERLVDDAPLLGAGERGPDRPGTASG